MTRRDRSEGRLRGRRLQQIRAMWFARFPLCVRCKAEGRRRVATQLDHIVPLFKGGPDFDVDDEKNRQGLCDECHEVKTREDHGHRPAVRIGVDGFPITPGG